MSGLKSKFAARSVVWAMVGLMTLPPGLPAWAANHPLSSLQDVNTMDYVVNVDWDFDNPPTQVGNTAQVVDRAFITSIIRTFAQSVFTFTEGRHRIGNVYIYRNKQFGTNVDIQLINKDGRSNASLSGWGGAGTTSHNYLTMGQAETADMVGKVVAHEMGHYTYGVADEYANVGTPFNPTIPYFPAETDSPKNSIMNNHLQFVSLSTPADYADPSARNTAQARLMSTGANAVGASAWETLTRTPDKDPEYAKTNFNRTFWEAFKDVDPQKLQLTRPTQGFDAKLNLLFITNPTYRDVLVVDRTLPADRLAIAIQGAKAMIAQAKSDTQYAIVASPPTGATEVLGYTTANDAGKAALTAALDGLASVATGTFDVLTAFTQGFQLLAKVRQTGDPATFHLLTGVEANFPQEAATSARQAKVSVNPMAVAGAGGQQKSVRKSAAKAQSATGTTVNLATLAAQTGGVFRTAKDATDAAKSALRSLKEAHGQSTGTLAVDESDALTAGSTFSSSFFVASAASDGAVTAELLFDPADANKLQFTLTGPDGKTMGTNNLASGITFTNHGTDGSVEFTIGSTAQGRVGNWTVGVKALSAVPSGVGVEVTSDQTLSLAGQVDGGTTGSVHGPRLRAAIGTDKVIRGAVVTANIYNVDGNLVMGNVALADDGVGQYVADLSGKLPAGEYIVALHGQTVAGSRIAAIGSPIQGPLNVETPVEALVRVAETSFTLDEGALGVLASATTSPAPTVALGGGGCTVSADGRDTGLLILLGIAAAGVALRRRRTR